MAAMTAPPPGLRALAAPLFVIMVLAMMVLPIPPFLLDLLFTFNIALSMIVIMVSLHTLKPLDFSVFPTVLLLTAHSTPFGHPFQRHSGTCSTLIRPGQSERSDARISG